MLSTPEIIDTPAVRTAVIRLAIPRSEIMPAMRAAIEELHRTLAGQSVAISGPMFSHHFRILPAEFDFEVGFPVAAEVRPQGRVLPVEMQAKKAVRATYTGSYEGLANAWWEFARQGREHTALHLQPAPDMWEEYFTGPESGLDPAHWRTNLYQPLLP